MAKKITVTVATKDGFERSDYALDVNFFDFPDEEQFEKELCVDWVDGTVSYIHLDNLKTLVVSR